MNFQGSGVRIDDYDLPRIGREIGVGEDEIHALLDVEASGSGFQRDGRLKMLWEPLWFYRHLTPDGKHGRPLASTAAGRALLAKRERAVREGLAQSTRPTGYPGNSYPLLERALLIDETAALKSASWGLGQIMGFNHLVVGYPTPQAMIRAFCEDEANHLQAIVRFIKEKKLDDDLRAHNWRGVALGYNGEGYEVMGYHIKLANAYQKWKRIPDTPYDPLEPEAVPMPRPPSAPPRPPVKTDSPKKGAGFWEAFLRMFTWGKT